MVHRKRGVGDESLLHKRISFGHGPQCNAAQERAEEGHQFAILVRFDSLVPLEHPIVWMERCRQWVIASGSHDLSTASNVAAAKFGEASDESVGGRSR